MITSLAMCLLLTGEPAPSRLAVIRPAPDFMLTNQDGKTVKLSDFQGKVVVVSFLFTTCNGTCPATTHRLAKVEQQLHRAYRPSPLDQPVVFLSITLDPQRDTPAALKKYVQLYDLNTKLAQFEWHFLTGTPEDVAKVVAAWGMWVKPTADGQLDHPSRIFLVDENARIREVYNVELLRPVEVMEDIFDLWRRK